MDRVRTADPYQRMPGQERRQVRRNADRTHAWPAASMRNRKRLVQVQVADVGADRRRTGQADLSVHVGAVHVHLTAVLVDDGADLPDVVLEDAVRRRVRDHQAGQPIAVLGGLLAQIRDVDVAVRRARDDDDAHPGHCGTRRIGAMRGRWNQHDVAMTLPRSTVERTNHHQTGELSLRT